MGNLFEKYDLNHKVDLFIEGYTRLVKKSKRLTDIGEFFAPRELRDYIEAIAVFTELRFPKVYRLEEAKRELNEQSKKIFDWNSFNLVFKEPLMPQLFNDSMVKEAALFRIIERGGNRIGARRGLLFAREFGFGDGVPAQYSIDFSDPHLLEFLEPLLPNLNLNMLCPVNYFSRSSDGYDNVREEKLEEIVKQLLYKEKMRKITCATTGSP